ncbi:hypothetical protein Nepgr_025452 [Nepenthes gracilis]|uniref:Uncharacterized protein n=1 Tax=Nepenthes gracilis TaxID=150966 RepID=A0AAD3Y124_NEPGR|nr:hypothetical protein Nepgr_025452 [Nepenthes gracilis]
MVLHSPFVVGPDGPSTIIAGEQELRLFLYLPSQLVLASVGDGVCVEDKDEVFYRFFCQIQRSIGYSDIYLAVNHKKAGY